jgi:hypothetical protein
MPRYIPGTSCDRCLHEDSDLQSAASLPLEGLKSMGYAIIIYMEVKNRRKILHLKTFLYPSSSPSL